MPKRDAGTARLSGYELHPKGCQPQSLQVRSIPAPAGLQWPPNALVMYYGQATAMQEISKAICAAMAAGMDCCSYQLDVDVGLVLRPPANLQTLKTTRMLNLDRCAVDVRTVIEQYWWEYLNLEGKTDDWIYENIDWNGIEFVTRRPDLIGRLAKEKEFAHLNLICMPVRHAGGTSRIGIVLAPDAIHKVHCRMAHAKVYRRDANGFGMLDLQPDSVTEAIA